MIHNNPHGKFTIYKSCKGRLTGDICSLCFFRIFMYIISVLDNIESEGGLFSPANLKILPQHRFCIGVSRTQTLLYDLCMLIRFIIKHRVKCKAQNLHRFCIISAKNICIFTVSESRKAGLRCQYVQLKQFFVFCSRFGSLFCNLMIERTVDLTGIAAKYPVSQQLPLILIFEICKIKLPLTQTLTACKTIITNCSGRTSGTADAAILTFSPKLKGYGRSRNRQPVIQIDDFHAEKCSKRSDPDQCIAHYVADFQEDHQIFIPSAIGSR